ncbi:hypothetical protein Tco_1217128 [Tanacetum coccineum]
MKAVPSITHRMIKFLVTGRTLMLRSSKIIPIECVMVSRPEDQPPLGNKVKEERIKVAINPEYPEQTIMIGSDLTERTRSKLCNLLQRSLDIIAGPRICGAQKGRGGTRFKCTEKVCTPVRQKKRGKRGKDNIAISKVNMLVAAGIFVRASLS